MNRIVRSAAGRRLLEPFCILLCLCALRSQSQAPLPASIVIEADSIQGPISPLLYGQFIEFMFGDIKGGLHAELVRNRSFEEPANYLGLSRYWERYPDDRNDDYGLTFAWDDKEFYPPRQKSQQEQQRPHSLRIDVSEGVIPRHGVYQNGVPVRQRAEYYGHVWLKT